jgi:hypothetical protein
MPTTIASMRSDASRRRSSSRRARAIEPANVLYGFPELLHPDDPLEGRHREEGSDLRAIDAALVDVRRARDV